MSWRQGRVALADLAVDRLAASNCAWQRRHRCVGPSWACGATQLPWNGQLPRPRKLQSCSQWRLAAMCGCASAASAAALAKRRGQHMAARIHAATASSSSLSRRGRAPCSSESPHSSWQLLHIHVHTPGCPLGAAQRPRWGYFPGPRKLHRRTQRSALGAPGPRPFGGSVDEAAASWLGLGSSAPPSSEASSALPPPPRLRHCWSRAACNLARSSTSAAVAAGAQVGQSPGGISASGGSIADAGAGSAASPCRSRAGVAGWAVSMGGDDSSVVAGPSTMANAATGSRAAGVTVPARPSSPSPARLPSASNCSTP